jgi:hypothetical protein
MNDGAVRQAAKQSLLLQHRGDSDTVIFDEFVVQHGISRIDLAVVNGELHGIELKSDKDTLSRLPEQAMVFGRVFDRITLIVGERHVRRAVQQVPDWWGIRVVSGEAGELRFCDLKHAIGNPSRDAFAIAALLWREEAVQFATELGVKGIGRSRTKAEIYAKLVSEAPLDILCQRVRSYLSQRPTWRFAGTRPSCGD